jgi:epoxyqueuosine reductase
MDFVSKCAEIVSRFPFHQFGFTDLARPLSMDFYRQWLAAGLQAGMTYLEDHADLKEDPKRLAPQARAAIVVTKSYFPHPYGEPPLPALRTALYSHGEDYHSRLKAELTHLAQVLHEEFGEHEFLCFTDSAPILERDLAYRAGLGWIGKNTCLIHPQKGSLFFIGQILTSLPLSPSPARIHDFCGTCDRCLRACPTQALEQPRLLNANKCIAYWTIEARSPAPEKMREHFRDWFFGCDICQTVCPWNEKTFGREVMTRLTATHESPPDEDLRWILRSSRKELARAFATSPLSRARPVGLKRNALVVIGNLRLRSLRGEVERCLDVPDLKEVAEWTLGRLN